MNILGLHRNLRARIAIGFVNRLLDAMITTFMAVYLADRYTIAVAGVLMFAVVSLGVFAMFFGGHLSDTRGRRPTLLLAETAACLSFGLMALGNSGAGGTVVVFVGYLVAKLASSVALPANDAVIVDVTTPEDRKGVYTINYWATNLALAVGSLLGGFLYHGHFTLLLLIAAVATGGALLTTFLVIGETRPAEAESAEAVHPVRAFVVGYRTVARDGRFLKFVAAATLGLAIEFQLVNYLGVRLSGLPAQNLLGVGQVDGVEMLGLVRAENTVLVVLLALFSHVVFKRIPDRPRLYVGIALFAAGYMVLAVSQTGWVLLVAGVVFTVGELMNVPVKQALLANMVPRTARPRYMAVYNLSIRFSQMIASISITLGALIGPWGMAAFYGLLGVAIILLYRTVLATADLVAAER
ncbi:MFS transporter [Amycolatopsis sp. NPDC026612]|uniref:MFS transporter n=1 Tax=Amycolatopsis sp. NPDC026612 TaxID=3155466 RepID=UPI0033C5E073